MITNKTKLKAYLYEASKKLQTLIKQNASAAECIAWLLVQNETTDEHEIQTVELRLDAYSDILAECRIIADNIIEIQNVVNSCKINRSKDVINNLLVEDMVIFAGVTGPDELAKKVKLLYSKAINLISRDYGAAIFEYISLHEKQMVWTTKKMSVDLNSKDGHDAYETYTNHIETLRQKETELQSKYLNVGIAADWIKNMEE